MRERRQFHREIEAEECKEKKDKQENKIRREMKIKEMEGKGRSKEEGRSLAVARVENWWEEIRKKEQKE